MPHLLDHLPKLIPLPLCTVVLVIVDIQYILQDCHFKNPFYLEIYVLLLEKQLETIFIVFLISIIISSLT